jgi:hypothetical protein
MLLPISRPAKSNAEEAEDARARRGNRKSKIQIRNHQSEMIPGLTFRLLISSASHLKQVAKQRNSAEF